jgi:hypothetical protein
MKLQKLPTRDTLDISKSRNHPTMKQGFGISALKGMNHSANIFRGTESFKKNIPVGDAEIRTGELEK